MTSIAIIGGGVAGLACARQLAEAGFFPKVFDKGRGPGGRVSTRRASADAEVQHGPFDHGAQYFTARDARFETHISAQVKAGHIAVWDGRFARYSPGYELEFERISTPRYVGVPGMNGLVKAEAADLGVQFNTRVAPPKKTSKGWALQENGTGKDLGTYDIVVVASPVEQAGDLLNANGAGQKQMVLEASRVRSAPCWAAMVSFDGPVALPADGIKCTSSPISWAARDSAKPGRPEGERWVLHGSADWSEAHLEDDKEAIADQLLTAFQEICLDLSVEIPKLAGLTAHRWRFAQVSSGAGEPYAFDPELGLACCGDWRLGPRIEAAWVSGHELGKALRKALATD